MPLRPVGARPIAAQATFPGRILLSNSVTLPTRALHEAGRLATIVLAPRNVVRIDPVTRELVLEGGTSLHARTVVLATA